MPAINELGELVHGRVWDWLTDDTVVGQRCAAGACEIVTAAGVDQPGQMVAPRGASAIAAGRGHWLAHLVDFGVFGPATPTNPTGLIPGGAIAALGADYNLGRGLAAPDGTIAVILDYQNARGLRLVAADGTWVDYPGVTPQVTQVAVVDRTRAVFVNWHTGRLETVGVMPVPQTLPGPVHWPTVLRIGERRWILYHTDGRIVLHPYDDARHGYVFPAAHYPHARVVDGRVVVAWASGPDDAPGDNRTIDVATEARVALTAQEPVVVPRVNRALWFGWYEFEPADLPGNCDLLVDRTLPYLVLRDHQGRELASYTAGNPDGDPDAIERAVAETKAARPDLPCIAYVPFKMADGQYVRWPHNADIIGVEAYRKVHESLDVFESRVRAACQAHSRVALIPQCYTSNTDNHHDLRAIVPVAARIARDVPSVQFMIPFSGSGRATGYQDHPEVHDAWQQVAASITTPNQEEPVSTVSVEIIDYDKTTSRRDPRGMLIRFDAGSERPITKIEMRMEYDEPPLTATFPPTRGSDGRYFRALAFKPVRTGSFHFTLTAWDESGASGSARSVTPVNVTEDPIEGGGGQPTDLEHLLRDRTELVKQIRRDLFGIPDDAPLNDERKAFQLTRAVAQALADEGWGVVRAKEGSSNNVDGFTSDVIAQRDGEHVDVVEDGDGKGLASWQPVRHRPEWEQSWNDSIAPRWSPP